MEYIRWLRILQCLPCRAWDWGGWERLGVVGGGGFILIIIQPSYPFFSPQPTTPTPLSLSPTRFLLSHPPPPPPGDGVEKRGLEILPPFFPHPDHHPTPTLLHQPYSPTPTGWPALAVPRFPGTFFTRRGFNLSWPTVIRAGRAEYTRACYASPARAWARVAAGERDGRNPPQTTTTHGHPYSPSPLHQAMPLSKPLPHLTDSPSLATQAFYSSQSTQQKSVTSRQWVPQPHVVAALGMTRCPLHIPVCLSHHHHLHFKSHPFASFLWSWGGLKFHDHRCAFYLGAGSASVRYQQAWLMRLVEKRPCLHSRSNPFWNATLALLQLGVHWPTWILPYQQSGGK